MADNDQLLVVMNGAIIGDVESPPHGRIRMRYLPSYAKSARFVELSASMPASPLRHPANIIAPWLEGLLPDRAELLRHWRRTFGVRDESAFSLLRHVGAEVTGAAQFVSAERLDLALAPGAVRPLSDNEIADLLRRAKANIPILDVDTHAGKFSLAGAQAKIALHRDEKGWGDPSGRIPTTHILKPAIPGMQDQDLIEMLTMRAAQAVGLRVADCSVEMFAGERAFVTRRYDRVLATRAERSQWVRVHQEDICQALSVAPMRKYQNQGGPGPAQIANLIRSHGSSVQIDLQRFAEAVGFNWLVCGTDAHARNYSMLIARDQYRLAPLYDLNTHLGYSAGPAVDLSMRVGRHFRANLVRASDWESFSAEVGVEYEWLRDRLLDMAGRLPDAVSDAAADIARLGFSSPVIPRVADELRIWTESARRCLS